MFISSLPKATQKGLIKSNTENNGGMTLSIMTLSITTLSIMTLSITTLSIMTLSITTLSIIENKRRHSA